MLIFLVYFVYNISQIFQYYLEVKIDNVLLAEYTWDNVNVEELLDVKVLAAASHYTPANAKIRNLEYKSGEKVGIYFLVILIFFVGRSKLTDTLATWGPEFGVSFDMKVNSFPSSVEKWAEILRFTDSDIADHRFPAIHINTAGFIEISPTIGIDKRPYPNVSTWNKYEMLQYTIKEQVRWKLNFTLLN